MGSDMRGVSGDRSRGQWIDSQVPQCIGVFSGRNMLETVPETYSSPPANTVC